MTGEPRTRVNACQDRTLAPPGRRCAWPARLALLVAASLTVVGCTAAADPDELARKIERFIPAGTSLDGTQWYSGLARNPSALERDGWFRIESPGEFRRLWEAQCHGEVPAFDWSRSTVVGVFLTRSEATGLRFLDLRRGPDGVYSAWFVGDTTPLTTVRYNYPFCVAVLPLRAGRIHVKLLYTRLQAIGGYALRDRGTRLTIGEDQ